MTLFHWKKFISQKILIVSVLDKMGFVFLRRDGDGLYYKHPVTGFTVYLTKI